MFQTTNQNTSCVPNNCGYKISVDKDVMVQPSSASARAPHMLHGWSVDGLHDWTMIRENVGEYSSAMDRVACIFATSKNPCTDSGWLFMITWWLIPLSKWVITPVINGISRVNPLITWVITHLLSGMSHQAQSLSGG